MRTIKLGSKNRDLVIVLQELLNKAGHDIAVDGVFGEKTLAAVRDYQMRSDLVVDGIVGPKTWTKLFSQFPEYNLSRTSKFLSERDILDVARELNLEVAVVKAVNEVESLGVGFVGGKPKILFEGHIFWKRLKEHDVDPTVYREGNEDILYPRWTSRYYKGGLLEHTRLERAKKIHEDAAYESASWGLFQIMGFHYWDLGYGSVKFFVKKMYESEREHLFAFAKFVKFHKLDRFLRNKEWARFARIYNGPGYKKNRYDEKLSRAYARYRKEKNVGSDGLDFSIV